MKKSFLALIITSFLFTAQVFAIESAAQQTSQDEIAAQMEMYEKLSRPGEYHKLLEDFAGTWNATVTMWMDPAAPPTVSKGSSTHKLIFDGRFIYGEFTGEFLGSPFKGINIMGYDNVKKEFVSVWIDNSSTGMVTARGTYDPVEKKFHFTSSALDPLSGQILEMREESYFANQDEYISVTYTKPGGGQEFKSMEMKYTRIK
jgi:hypothetical protein